jgi:hypothetical protein
VGSCRRRTPFLTPQVLALVRLSRIALANLGDSGIAAKRWDQRFVMPTFVDLNNIYSEMQVEGSTPRARGSLN